MDLLDPCKNPVFARQTLKPTSLTFEVYFEIKRGGKLFQAPPNPFPNLKLAFETKNTQATPVIFIKKLKSKVLSAR